MHLRQISLKNTGLGAVETLSYLCDECCGHSNGFTKKKYQGEELLKHCLTSVMNVVATAMVSPKKNTMVRCC
jgi:hypothetical protein